MPALLVCMPVVEEIGHCVAVMYTGRVGGRELPSPAHPFGYMPPPLSFTDIGAGHLVTL